MIFVSERVQGHGQVLFGVGVSELGIISASVILLPLQTLTPWPQQASTAMKGAAFISSLRDSSRASKASGNIQTGATRMSKVKAHQWQGH